MDQQTLERELEREEAGHQLQLLTGSLAEREKEYERAKNYLEQMTSELELFQQKEHHWRNVEQVTIFSISISDSIAFGLN